MALVKAGQEIDAWCTKCRLNLLHRVVAVVAGEPKRVECKTCHSQHNYRTPKGTATVRAAKAAPKRSATANADEWTALVAGKDQGVFIPYTITTRFKPEQLVRHKKFGNGFVTAVLDDQKISVLFKDGPRTLIHNRQ